MRRPGQAHAVQIPDLASLKYCSSNCTLPVRPHVVGTHLVDCVQIVVDVAIRRVVCADAPQFRIHAEHTSLGSPVEFVAAGEGVSEQVSPRMRASTDVVHTPSAVPTLAADARGARRWVSARDLCPPVQKIPTRTVAGIAA